MGETRTGRSADAVQLVILIEELPISKEHTKISRPISTQVSRDKIRADLEDVRQEALGLGASLARVISSSWVEIDERVRLKCSVPLCPHYGKNIYCPPHGPEPEYIRLALSRYGWAIVFALDVPPNDFISHPEKKKRAVAGWAKKGFEIAGRVETAAFGKGYYLAMGFGQASCRKVLCGLNMCLVLDGGKCPYPLKARPSMESAGIDVFGLTTRLGWGINPIYRSVDPKRVNRALSVGIIFIH